MPWLDCVRRISRRCVVSQDASSDSPVVGVVHLGHGIVWHCCEFKENGCLEREDAQGVASALKLSAATQPTATDLTRALMDLEYRNQVQELCVLVPEQSAALDYCEWDGDGHYDMSKYAHAGLPTLGQIISHVKMVDEMVERSRFTIHLSSEKRRGCGALLAGAVLILSHGSSAAAAWEEVSKDCPLSVDPRWDHFSRPFSKSRRANSTSLTVLDCLEGIELARDRGWFGPGGYREFDVALWRLLRKKLDASWIIPGEVLAMAHPLITVSNPSFEDFNNLADLDVLLGIHDVSQSQDCEVACKLAAPSMDADANADGYASGRSFVSEMSNIELNFNERIAELNDSDVDNSCTARVIDFISSLRSNGFTTVFELCHACECPQHDDYLKALNDVGLGRKSFAFDDGNAPPEKIVSEFLEVCRDELSSQCFKMAVHCRGGLGRTSAIVGAYAVACHGVPGKAFHGWMRMCRPGSVQTQLQEAFLRQLRPASKRGSLNRRSSSKNSVASSQRSRNAPKEAPTKGLSRSGSKNSVASARYPRSASKESRISGLAGLGRSPQAAKATTVSASARHCL